MLKNIINKFLILTTITLCIFLFTSCKKDKTSYLQDPVAVVYKNKLPYIINLKGESFDLSKYDSIVPYFDDILIVKKDNLFGYIKNTGEPLTDIVYNSAYPFKEGKAVVSLENKFYIINTNADVLYTFENEVFSSSSFSENKLVITKDKKQGYLKYDEETNSFDYLITTPINEETSVLESNLIYDYCGEFTNGYAVVGNLNANGEFKYTHISNDGNKLYDLEWDYAANFINGYAVVGDYMDYKVKIYCSKESIFDENVSTEAITIGYMYISPEGKYISYQTTETDEEGKEYIVDKPYIFALAKDFSDNIALVANLYYYVGAYDYRHNYDLTENKFFYNYYFIDFKGNQLFGQDDSGKSNLYVTNWGNGSSYNEIFNLGDYHITTFRTASWRIQYTKIGTYDPINAFENITFDLKNTKLTTDDPEGMTLNDKLIKKFPWIESYLDNFTTGDKTATYAIDHVIAPYQLSSFKNSKYLEAIVAKSQTYSGTKDTTGLISINLTDTGLELSYIIPPLYEDIIY